MDDNAGTVGYTVSAPALVVDDQLVRLLYGKTKTRDELEPEEEEYLSQLTSFGIERLNKEPQLRRDEGLRIKKDMEELAHSNYKTFIHTSQCIREIGQQMKQSAAKVNAIQETLPTLSKACEHFVEQANAITQERAINKAALQQHQQLLKLLEVPQWMDTCVRSGFYEESLQLQAFATKLAQKFPNQPIVQSIVEEVKASSNILLAHLHQKLRTSLQLPACLRIIGFLRRLDVYSEQELRICFLESRDSWLMSVVEAIPSNNAYTFLNKLTDTSRAHLFEIITQYRAIFTDDSNSDTDGTTDSNILHSWLTHKVSDYLETLERHLPKISDGGSLLNILDQSMYLGMSLSRVGVEFRGLLMPIFERHILSIFTSNVQNATTSFVGSIKRKPATAADASKSSQSILYAATERREAHAPNARLLDFPVLALLCNAYLGALNELRQCAPVTIMPAAARALSESLLVVASTIKATFPADDAYGKEFARTTALHLVPYIAECFELVFQQTTTTTTAEIDAANIVGLLGQLYSPAPPAAASNAAAASATASASPSTPAETVDR